MAADKKILTIQDISCVGQCSLTVALPIVSACGVETCILPSAVLSNHTGADFHGFTFRDLTEDMPEISAKWKKEHIAFDAIYTGYLGSRRQIAIVQEIMDTLLAPGGLRIVDPAMADNGALYTGFDLAFVEEMAALCGGADYILPNLTEACLLTGTAYREGLQSEAEIRELLKKLAALGAKHVILKGISYEEGRIGNVVYDSASDDLATTLPRACREAATEPATALPRHLPAPCCGGRALSRRQSSPRALWLRAYARPRETTRTGTASNSKRPCRSSRRR